MSTGRFRSSLVAATLVFSPTALAAQFEGLRTLNPSAAPTSPILRTIPGSCKLPPEQLQPLETSYLDVLRWWAAGAPDALATLDDISRRLIDGAAGFPVSDATVDRLLRLPDGRTVIPGVGCLEEIESRVQSSLMATAPDLALPLFGLYLKLYERQLTPPPFRHWLATRSRDRLLWLADEHRRLAVDKAGARRTAGEMLVALADVTADAVYYPARVEARDLFTRAARLVPEALAPRYRAAALAERLGDYEDAALRFSSLARRFPDDPEIQLRRALNHRRDGRRRGTLEALEALAHGDGPAWVRIVAFEELAAASDSETAQRLLEEAAELFPYERQLRIALTAHQLDNPRDLDHLAAPLGHPETAPSISARGRYDRPRRDETDAIRAALSERIAALRQRLAEKLG